MVSYLKKKDGAIHYGVLLDMKYVGLIPIYAKVQFGYTEKASDELGVDLCRKVKPADEVIAHRFRLHMSGNFVISPDALLA